MSGKRQRASSSGDTWLTSRDAELLHLLADGLPAHARRDIARCLHNAGELPDDVDHDRATEDARPDS